MYFFIVKAIAGAIIGQSTNAWFRKTKMGVWFYKKIDRCYNWAAKRYDLDVLTKEEKLINPFLRYKDKVIMESVANHYKKEISNSIEVFHHTRMWKDTEYD